MSRFKTSQQAYLLRPWWRFQGKPSSGIMWMWSCDDSKCCNTLRGISNISISKLFCLPWVQVQKGLDGQIHSGGGGKGKGKGKGGEGYGGGGGARTRSIKAAITCFRELSVQLRTASSRWSVFSRWFVFYQCVVILKLVIIVFILEALFLMAHFHFWMSNEIKSGQYLTGIFCLKRCLKCLSLFWNNFRKKYKYIWSENRKGFF